MHERRLGIMSRRLRKMLLRVETGKAKLRILRDIHEKRAAAGFLIILRHIDIHKARMKEPGRRDGKEILSCLNSDGEGAVPGIRHPARRESSPDQLVKSELIPGK